MTGTEQGCLPCWSLGMLSEKQEKYLQKEEWMHITLNYWMVPNPTLHLHHTAIDCVKKKECVVACVIVTSCSIEKLF